MRRNQKGFTLMELMVVIVIVAVLAAVAVPLYINYVKDAQRTEAKGAIGAIITAEQAFYLRCSSLSPDPTSCPKYTTLDVLKTTNLIGPNDIADAEFKWTIEVVNPSPTGYTVSKSSTCTFWGAAVRSRTTSRRYGIASIADADWLLLLPPAGPHP
ncbi:MAG: prepilin-type N-terminal cleavage/methylation domain-containing protein [Candidatus Eisenbacteria bacterium]|nr:prepilin-type N-terminal cleavage/methylation domain-containing protein [Candidatus Eisenbacteria bacterium]